MIALLGAMLALGRATAPPEPAAAGSSTTTIPDPLVVPTTTTTIDVDTFSIGQIATGQRFTWFRAPRLEPFRPIELIEHRDSTYLFGSSEGQQSEPRGLRAWVSADGIIWDSLGAVIGADYVINGVDSTTSGLIATGNHVETKTPHIWVSSDGETWQISDLPGGGEDDVPSFARPTVATEVEDRIIVLGNAQSDLFPQIVERLPVDVKADDVFRYGFDISDRPEGRSLQIHGPLGIIGYSETLERLGIDDEMATWLLYTAETENALAWSSTDGSHWELRTFNAYYIEHIWHGPGDRLLASGLGLFGPMVWQSADGRTWERLGSSTIGRVQALWEDALIATTDDRHLLRSSDGLEWSYLGTGDLLPASVHWAMGPIAGGEAGLAVLATMRREADQPFAPAVIEKEGHVITIDPSMTTMRVERSTGDVFTIPLRTSEPSEATSVDFVNREVTFMDPETAEALVSIDFDTLDRAGAFMTNAGVEEEQALLFTKDGRRWTIQDLSEEIGPEGLVSHMAVLQDRVILITLPPPRTAGDSGPDDVAIRVGIVGPGDTG